MKSPERVVFIGGVGNEPLVQDSLAELWLPHGLFVEHQPINWATSDYNEKLEDIGSRIVQLSTLGRVSMVGASGGGKTALSLFANQPDYIHRVVTISSKIDPYILGSGTQKAYPNLVTSSDIFPEHLNKITSEMRKKVLCISPLNDEIVAPEDTVLEGAFHYTVQANDHNSGIARALSVEAQVIADFIHQD